MWLVLCAGGDESAIWAWRRLRRTGRRDVALLTAESFAEARIEHRVGDDGASFVIESPGVGRIASEEVEATLNRLAFPPSDHLRSLPPGDREYAFQETGALLLSMLHALRGPVLNPPTPVGLAGRWRSEPEWLDLAARSGFATRSHRATGGVPPPPPPAPPPDALSVLAIGSRVLSRRPLAPATRGAVTALAERAGAPVLGARVADPEPGSTWPRFVDATPLPDLRPGGDAAVEALHDALSGALA